MNAVVAVTETTVTCEPTKQHPRELIVHRLSNYVHVTLLSRATRTKLSELIGVAGSKSTDVTLKIDGPKSWLQVGGASFAVTQTEAERLRDELQLPVRVQS